tara:strand:- start:227 stop:382 length:156 start_codon:yes stop_codon:yes gene_type:complete
MSKILIEIDGKDFDEVKQTVNEMMELQKDILDTLNQIFDEVSSSTSSEVLS